MKKLLALLCAVMLICAPLVACAGGDTEQDESGGITAPGTDTDTDGGDQDPPAVTQEPIVYDDALETEIEELYKEVDEASDGVLHSFGVYGGYTAVVELNSYLAPDMKVFTAAGKQFVFPTCAEVRAYNGGKLYTVAQAYENEFLSDEDVADIYRRFNLLNYGCEEGFDPSVIDVIKSNYAERHNTTADNVFVDIRGVYGDAYALWVRERGSAMASVGSYEVAANVLFEYNDLDGIEVYDGTRFYSLSRAYKEGILSRNEIIDLRNHYGKYDIFVESGLFALRQEVAEVVGRDVEEVELEVYAILGKDKDGAVAGFPGYAMIITGWFGVGAAQVQEEVAGILFVYGQGPFIEYYYNGRICSLGEAYESGYIDVDQVAMIHYYQENKIMSVV